MSKYKLLYDPDFVDYNGNEITDIGCIIDTETNETVMYIFYDCALYQHARYHMMASLKVLDGREFPVAYIDDSYKKMLYERPNIFFTLALHEYGHYINGDLDTDMTHEEIRHERIRCAQEGRVMETELKADAFAVSQVGKNLFMRAMDFSIQQRKERNDQAMTLAIKEFENRKKAARKLH